MLFESKSGPETVRTSGFVILYALIPGVMFAIYIQCRTTKTRPPKLLMFIYAMCAFVMSICWISFTSDVIIDLLAILSMVLQIPPAALGLSILAWGVCLGDLQVNTAMTKKGFGEMAITGCLAGPIFNLNIGLGGPMVLVFLQRANEISEKDGRLFIPWSLFQDNGELQKKNVVPIVLIIGVIFIYLMVLLNGCKNKYSLSAAFHYPTLVIYGLVIVGLVIYAVLFMS